MPFAAPLLQVLPRLRDLPAEADPAALRDLTEAGLRTFEHDALAAGLPPDHVRRGHYALCDSLDTAALNTPWGAGSDWGRRGLVATFHPAIGPGRFRDALAAAQARAPELRPVLELMMLCLSLGVPDEAARQSVAGVLSQGITTPPLSARWEGMDAPYRARPRPPLPVWVAGAAALAIAAALFVQLRAGVDAAGDALFAAMLAMPPSHMPPIAREPAPPLPPPPPDAAPSVADRLRARLPAAPGLSVIGPPGAPVVRLSDSVLFAPDDAAIRPAAALMLAQVAAALEAEGVAMRVLGFADNRPMRTVAFPSAFKLTAARAEAVRAALLRAQPTLRASAEGRGGAEPAADNATDAGRAENRRIDIVPEFGGVVP